MTRTGFWAKALVALLALGGPLTGRPAPPAPVPVAIQNAPALDPFLEALRQLAGPHRQRPVRVLQFGDSHTAADFWSGRVRSRLQARYGDGGPGWILPARPWRGYPHEGVKLLQGLHWPAQSLRSSACDGWVGLTGASLTPVAGETFQVQAAWGQFQVHLLGPAGQTVARELENPTDPSGPPTRVEVPRLAEEPLETGDTLQSFGLQAAPGETGRDLRLLLPPDVHLLGLDLVSGRPGVIYDELGLNGAELLDLERWRPDLRRLLLAKVKPDLLVLAYGTNDMGHLAQGGEDYQARAVRLLQALRQESGASILVVGPLDRLGSSRRARPGLKAGAATVIQALQAACKEAGCAFWDARRAMGGYGSIQRWRRAGLAQKDLVHLTGPGYQRLGDALATALEAAADRSQAAAAPERPARSRGKRPPVRPHVRKHRRR